jgi:hypothetical protein
VTTLAIHHRHDWESIAPEKGGVAVWLEEPRNGSNVQPLILFIYMDVESGLTLRLASSG